ncbi:tetratricopeptide repeat protein [Maribacter chungangensis]|uniref:Tetratricopeptide repeat protein n=1 Tax=Maribacter chungangensis TaxID=1069117 RepID=A0ABW3AZN1_9FLAO
MIKYSALGLLFFTLLGRGQSVSIIEADSLYATGNYTKAINAYATLGTLRAGIQIARAYSAIGNMDKAIAQYQAVLEGDAKQQLAHFELGKLFLKSKAYDEARKSFQFLVSTAGDNPEYHYYLGEAYRNLEQAGSSLVSYKNAVAKDSTHLRSLFQLGKYFTVKREKNQALHYIDQGLRFYENDVAMVNLKALVLYNDGRYADAIPWLEKVLALGEQKEYVYEKLAHSYYKEWEFEKAKSAYRELLKFNDTHSDYYYALAETYRKNKQLDSATILVKKGMDIQRPVLAKGFMALSGLAREKEDLKMALEYLQLAVAEDPNDGMLYFRLCTLIDRFYKDPVIKLEYYERYVKRFGAEVPFFSGTAKKRISELKEQIHYAKEPTD